MLLVYKTGLVEQIDELHPTLNTASSFDSSSSTQESVGREATAGWTLRDARDTAAADMTSHETHEELWQSLSPNHWPTLFAAYNMSLTGRSL